MPVLLSALLVVAAGGLVRRAHNRREALRWRTSVDASLAPVVELIAVVLGAGGSLAQAVGTVAERGPEVVRPAFARVVATQKTGLLLSDALVSLTADLGPAFHPLTTTLIVTEQSGTPVGLLLQRLADEAQLARNRAVTEALGRLPVALLVPLVVCQLPALIVGSVIPLTIVALRHVGG